MSTFTFLHEINDFVYAIRDCSAGSADAIKRGEVIAYNATAGENSTATPTHSMTYSIKFDGDTFTTSVVAPFTVTTSQSLLADQNASAYGSAVGSPAFALTNEGTFVVGSGYLAGDTITLSDGSVVSVDSVATIGSPEVVGTVAGFTLTTSSGATVVAGTALTQLSTTAPGSPAAAVGIGFTLTPGSDNVTQAGFLVAETTTNSTVFADKADAVVAYAADLA